MVFYEGALTYTDLMEMPLFKIPEFQEEAERINNSRKQRR